MLFPSLHISSIVEKITVSQRASSKQTWNHSCLVVISDSVPAQLRKRAPEPTTISPIECITIKIIKHRGQALSSCDKMSMLWVMTVLL